MFRICIIIISFKDNLNVYLNQKKDLMLNLIHFKVAGSDTRPYTALLFRHFSPKPLKEATPYNLVIPFSVNVIGPI